MQQFDNNEPNTGMVLEDEYKKELKKSHRRGMVKGIAITVVVCLVFMFVTGGVFSFQDKTKIPVNVTEDGEQHQVVLEYDPLLDESDLDKINTLAAAIQAYYYEDVDKEALIEGVYAGLFESLDIYSEYMTKAEYDELYNMEISGNYCGIGATLTQDINTMIVEVVSVQEGSPAERAGIQKGDLIIQADEYEAMSMSLDEFVTHLRGEAGTSVTVEVYRESSEEYLTFDIVREALDVQSVEYEMLDGHIGYIIISQFMGTTADHFADALEDLKSQGMTSLIVDVRSNPGGLVSAVTEILDMLLPEGILVYTEDKYGNRQDYMATDDEVLDMPMVVLVNEHSASASEIFAGAVKDYEAGTLVGTTTYGKGIVQGVSTLPDGSAFKLTNSRYYTPNGICIHGTGIDPDVVLEYEFLGGEEETYAYEYDNQIQKALEILHGEE